MTLRGPLTVLFGAAILALSAPAAQASRPYSYTLTFTPYVKTVRFQGRRALELTELVVSKRGRVQYSFGCKPLCPAYIVGGRHDVRVAPGKRLFRLDWLLGGNAHFAIEEGVPGVNYGVFAEYRPRGGGRPRLLPDRSGCVRTRTVRGRVYFGRRIGCPAPPPAPPQAHGEGSPKRAAVPPHTTISSGPPPFSGSTTAVIAFSSDQPGSTFLCQLDAGAWSPCGPSSWSAGGVAVGDHTFRVQATNSASLTSNVASVSWVVLPEGGGFEEAFQGTNGDAFEAGPAGIVDTTLRMAPRTSPSIAAYPNGGYELAIQAADGTLVLLGSSGPIFTGQAMRPDTSPSIAASPDGGYEGAYEGSDGLLYAYSSTGSVQPTGQGMDNSTSPAIAALPGGGYEMAFQANTTQLIVFGTAEKRNTAQGMQPGTSPSIAASPDGGFQAVFQANNTSLYRYDSASGPAALNLGLDPASSPSIAAVSGGYEIAFEANTDDLWVVGAVANSGLPLGMLAGSSPGIAATSGGFQATFQANTGQLYSYNTLSGANNLQQPMAAGSSPSIAP